MAREGLRGVRFVVEHLADDRQAQPEPAQEQDALELHQGRLVVVPVAVVAGAAGLEQADVVVVPQRPAGGAGDPGDVLDGPIHVSSCLSSFWSVVAGLTGI